MTETGIEFTRRMVRNVPELGPLLQAHEADYGDLLPHVFFGDLTRFVTDLNAKAGAGSKSSETVLVAILRELEEAVTARNIELRDLVIASFLENLERADPLFGTLRARLGKGLRTALANQDRASREGQGDPRRRNPYA